MKGSVVPAALPGYIRIPGPVPRASGHPGCLVKGLPMGSLGLTLNEGITKEGDILDYVVGLLKKDRRPPKGEMSPLYEDFYEQAEEIAVDRLEGKLCIQRR